VSDIFLSYANEDRQRVLSFARGLEAAGWTVFWDRTIPAGKTWRQVIGREVKDCRCMIVVWTQHSVDSNWVQDEAEEGKRREILVPVMFDDVTPPFGFGHIQAADLTGWNGSTDAPAFKRLIEDISTTVPPARPATGSAPVEDQATESRRREESETPRASEIPIAPLPKLQEARSRLKPALAVIAVAVVLMTIVLLVKDRTPDSPASSVKGETTQAQVPSRSATPDVQKAEESPVSVLSLSAPPSGYFVLDTIGPKPDTTLRLTEVSARPNTITDDEEWWAGNRLEPLTYKVVPDSVPQQFRGLRLLRAIKSNPVLAIYGENYSDGRYVLAVNSSNGKTELAADFSAFLWPHEFDQSEKQFVRMSTTWVQLEAGVLYVSQSHRTYARSSKGYNAYVSAIDARSGTLLWHSQPLVSNAENFIIHGDAIITGYGFTAEPDYLYVLNKADGRMVQKVPVRSGPDHLIEKDDRLFVRTYNTDYVFGFSNQ
jgi:hypothetical protein